MSDQTRYKVLMNGSILPNEDREKVIRELCELFHSRPSTIEKLLNGSEVYLKKEYSHADAQKISKAIRNAGAQCRVVAVKDSQLAIADDDDTSYLSGLSVNESVNIMNCPSCARECDARWDSCEYCGHVFVRRERDSGFSFSSLDADSVEEDADKREARKSLRTEVVRFIGPNADFYMEKFSGMGSVRKPRFRPSWHWPALFGFFFWALYRKMWTWAAINQVTAILLILLSRPSFLWLIFILFWPLCANYLYFVHVGHYLTRSRKEAAGEPRELFLSEKGGVSRLAMWVGFAAMVMVSVYSTSMMTNSLLDKYNEEFSAPNGEPGSTQVRGDGRLLVSSDLEDPQVDRTSRVLSTLATAFKVVVATGNDEAINSTIDSLVEKSEDEEIRDAWNHPVIIERAVDRVVFQSLGPDGRDKTDDDILQTVNY